MSPIFAKKRRKRPDEELMSPLEEETQGQQVTPRIYWDRKYRGDRG